MVLEIIREKDQADFRGVRNDFSSRMGGGSIEVCFLHEYSANLPVGWVVGGSHQIAHVTCKLMFKCIVFCCQKRVSLAAKRRSSHGLPDGTFLIVFLSCILVVQSSFSGEGICGHMFVFLK